MACALCGLCDAAGAPAATERRSAGACGHAACLDCCRVWVEEELRWQVPASRVRCFGAGCSEVMPQDLVHELAPQSADLPPRGPPACTDLTTQIRMARLCRSDLGGHVVWPRQGQKSVECPSCGEQCFALMGNSPCHHAMCEDCWTRAIEESIPSLRERCCRSLAIKCPKPGCGELVHAAFLANVAQASQPVADFLAQVRAEVARLHSTAEEVLVWGQPPCMEGPFCPVCKRQRFALLANPGCCHTACEECWAKWCEEQLPRCRSQVLSRLAAPCIEPGCGCEMGAVIAKHAGTISAPVKQFSQAVEAELSRLRKSSGQMLALGSSPSEAGPECPVCRERCLALLGHGDCGHATCEDCWASWFATQLDHCRIEKRVAATCFAPGCQRPASTALWSHACTRNEEVRRLEAQLAFRRRLVANPLYPAEVQEECPGFACVGLGYRGFDTVMCFVCERQWPAGQGGTAPPEGLGEELMAGEVMKQCPRCKEYIIKNGGCDHMTCRCRFEFWWSTLQPYRDEAGNVTARPAAPPAARPEAPPAATQAQGGVAA